MMTGDLEFPANRWVLALLGCMWSGPSFPRIGPGSRQQSRHRRGPHCLAQLRRLPGRRAVFSIAPDQSFECQRVAGSMDLPDGR